MPKCHETAHFFQSSTGGSLLLSPYICSNIQNLMSSWKCSTQLIFISTYRLAPIYFFLQKITLYQFHKITLKTWRPTKITLKTWYPHYHQLSPSSSSSTSFSHSLFSSYSYLHYLYHLYPTTPLFLNKDVPKKHMQMLISKWNINIKYQISNMPQIRIFSIMIKIRKILDIYWEFFPNDGTPPPPPPFWEPLSWTNF